MESAAFDGYAPLTRGVLDASVAGDMAPMFKALGDPVRLRLLSLIASHPDREVCVCDMSEDFDLSSPTISYHLKVLRAAGLITADRRGTWVYYSTVATALDRLARLLDPPGEALSAVLPAEMGREDR
ncbi:metalloregulator ArsR/SmtB family transcription factor [Sphaerisporangium sp. NPDC005289]|uniref:ArsR/SmtB family transcription factor n=1 Tax=Sphaerisporangium sp. NPDC005289 TaxID=3155247 RepID=UPI0033B6C54B